MGIPWTTDRKDMHDRTLDCLVIPWIYALFCPVWTWLLSRAYVVNQCCCLWILGLAPLWIVGNKYFLFLNEVFHFCDYEKHLCPTVSFWHVKVLLCLLIHIEDSEWPDSFIATAYLIILHVSLKERWLGGNM
jgi:hypothetical protein